MKYEPVFTDYLGIVDKNGKTRITLDASSGEPAIGILGSRGGGIILGIDEKTGNPFVSMSDKKEKLMYSLAVDEEKGKPELLIRGNIVSDSSDYVETKGLVVRNDDNQALISFGFDDESEQPRLSIIGKDGSTRLSVSVDEETESTTLMLFGKNKESMMALTTDAGTGAPCIKIHVSPDGGGMSIRSGKAGYNVWLNDSEGRPRASLGIQDNGIRAATYDENGVANWASDRDCQPLTDDEAN